MKKAIIALSSLFLFTTAIYAQDERDEEPKAGFKKENLFTGGSLSVSFFSGGTILGGTPIFGYRIADWLDAGVAFNYIYSGRRDYPYFGDKIRQHTYGPGVFTRLYPVNFLFLQGQFEHNFMTQKYIPGNGTNSLKFKEDVSSFLVGVGYAQGRDKFSNSFYYISVLFDVLKDINSPYTEVVYDQNNEPVVRVVPIFRAGFNIPLFQGRY